MVRPALAVFFERDVQTDFRLEDVDLSRQTGAHDPHDLARVRGALVDQGQHDTQDVQVRIELLADGGDGLEDLRQALDGQEVGLNGMMMPLAARSALMASRPRLGRQSIRM